MRYDYNTQRDFLRMPEYGRNLQRMVQYMMSVPDINKRKELAHVIVSVMANLNPHYRENLDFKHKLWDHLSIIADFNLDIETPYPKPTPDVLTQKPNRVPYCKNSIKIKHYGKNIENMLAEAKAIDDPQRKQILLNQIANYMKRLYLTWNNEEIVNDDQIYRDLEEIGDNSINIDKNQRLSDSRDLIERRPSMYQNKKFKKHKKK